MSPDVQLEQLLKILVDRFGPNRSLGQVYATTYALRVHREGGVINLTDVAQQTGISKQNLSRWREALVRRERVLVQPYEDDGRIQFIDVINPHRACRHLPAVAEIFACPLDPSR